MSSKKIKGKPTLSIRLTRASSLSLSRSFRLLGTLPFTHPGPADQKIENDLWQKLECYKRGSNIRGWNSASRGGGKTKSRSKRWQERGAEGRGDKVEGRGEEVGLCKSLTGAFRKRELSIALFGGEGGPVVHMFAGECDWIPVRGRAVARL